MKNLFKIFDSKHRSRTISYLIVIAIYIAVELVLNFGKMPSLIKNLLVPCC